MKTRWTHEPPKEPGRYWVKRFNTGIGRWTPPRPIEYVAASTLGHNPNAQWARIPAPPTAEELEET